MPLPMYQSKEESSSTNIKHIVGIAAGKGGVGKSTVSVNLALVLQKMGYSVGILDADIYGPSLRKMLPESQLPSQKGDVIIPAICSGIKMISMAYFRKEKEAAVIRAPIANNLISQFIKNIQWGSLDFLLIDFPPGTGDIQLTLSQQANLRGALMVTTPQEVSVMDVRKAIHMFSQVRIPIIGIVENMSYYQHPASNERLYLFGKGGGERLSRESGTPFLGAIPIDPILSASGDNGQSIFNENNGDMSLAAQSFHVLAKNFLEQVELVKEDLIQQIIQKDHYSFTIIWKNGKTADYCLSELQKKCPCAGCLDENSGKRLMDQKSIDPEVKAKAIYGVGRYALRIDFTSGCSKGIYDFDMLKMIEK